MRENWEEYLTSEEDEGLLVAEQTMEEETDDGFAWNLKLIEETAFFL